LLKLGRSSLV